MMPPHKRYYQDDLIFNGVYSRYNLPNKRKDGAYVINLDKYVDIGAYLITLYSHGNTEIYFGSFGVEDIPKAIKKIIDKNRIQEYMNYRIQAYNTVKCRYFCIRFIVFMLQGKSRLY